MSKAILKFDLNDRDDRLEHLKCLKSNDLCIAIWDISILKRKIIDHIDLMYEKKQTVSASEITDYIFEKIDEILENHNIKELID